MIRRKFFWPLTVLILLIIQISFCRWIAIAGVFPNLILLGTTFFALQKGSLTGEWIGFSLGLFSDSASISLFGSQAFMCTLIGYLTGRLQGKINAEKPLAQMSVVLSMSFLFLIGLIFFEMLFGGQVQRFQVKSSIFQPIYSALIAPVIFILFSLWHSFFHKKNSKWGIFE